MWETIRKGNLVRRKQSRLSDKAVSMQGKKAKREMPNGAQNEVSPLDLKGRDPIKEKAAGELAPSGNHPVKCGGEEQEFKQINGQEWIRQMPRGIWPDCPEPILTAEDERDRWLEETLKKGSLGKEKMEGPSGGPRSRFRKLTQE